MEHQFKNLNRKSEHYHINVPGHYGQEISDLLKIIVAEPVADNIFYCHEVEAIAHTHIALRAIKDTISPAEIIAKICVRLLWPLSESYKVHVETGHKSLDTIIKYHYVPKDGAVAPCEPPPVWPFRDTPFDFVEWVMKRSIKGDYLKGIKNQQILRSKPTDLIAKGNVSWMNLEKLLKA